MSVWLPTAPCTPETCLTEAAPVVALPRRILRLGAFLVVLVAGLALTPSVRALPGGPRDALVRFWARTLLRALGVTARIAPPPACGGGVLVVANHVSWLDIPLIAAGRPGRSLAKTEVRQWPVLGPLVAWGGTVFLDRDRLRTLPGTVAAVTELLRAGRPVVVFPEGSTWCGRESGRFRPALFEAAVQSGAPVQPVTVRYRLADGRATNAPAFVGEDGLLASIARVVSVRGLVAEVTFLPAIPAPAVRTGQPADRRQPRRELARAAQAAVEATGR
ncbi:1-acyl-sn-glycerol-3-phosphate acyltransferase [Kitasatospora sp. NBC_01246]|uniref:lysophospholipid acyltransferase family protein n=1 Tax=Kitasatospora sp. NBC_01246 TaxID=2903570 RepID=UPI002E344015|nr:lysophospholipid acyltransferase family protein [Kitasatospora sp. NBC_01246]